jgi:hypothetical protein
MFMKKKILLFILCLVPFSSSFSQDQRKVDSLENELKKFEEVKRTSGNEIHPLYDTAKASILYAICEEFWMNGPEKGMYWSTQLLQLSKEIGYRKGITNALNSIGVIHFYEGNYSQAFENHKAALKISEDAGDKNGIAGTHQQRYGA